MTKRKIYFRADGNIEIGYGHVIRSLALLNMLKDDFECIFVTRYKNDFLKNQISKVCNKLILLSKGEEHFNEFLELLNGDEIVVLDNYFFTTQHQKQIKKKKAILVCIDDLGDKHFVSDAIINHIDITPYKKYSKEKYTKLFLGIENALLRKEFFEERISNNKKKNTLLIAFGGVDFNNLTYKYLNIVLKHKLDVRITVVINTANFKYNNILKLRDKHSNLEILSNLSSEEMKCLMVKTKVAILPSSSMCIEGLALGIDVISGYYVNNQKYAYDFFYDNRFIYGLGDLNIPQEDLVISVIKSKLKQDNFNFEIINQISSSKLNHIRNFKSLVNEC